MMPLADHHDLNRFVLAQAPIYQDVLAELSGGRKRSHWMWFIFLQIDGLGFSATTRRYSIKSNAEAQAYLEHPLLGARLVECSRTVNDLNGPTALDVFGTPDNMKLQSSMTLFAQASHGSAVFSDVLDKYFNGKQDPRTVNLIKAT